MTFPHKNITKADVSFLRTNSMMIPTSIPITPRFDEIHGDFHHIAQPATRSITDERQEVARKRRNQVKLFLKVNNTMAVVGLLRR